jgi:hypothetical protein
VVAAAPARLRVCAAIDTASTRDSGGRAARRVACPWEPAARYGHFFPTKQRKTAVTVHATQTMAWLKTALTVAAIFVAIVAAFSLSAGGGGLGEDTVVAISGDGSPVPADEVPAGSASAAGMPR